MLSATTLIVLRAHGELQTAEMVRDFVLILGWLIAVSVATNQQVAAQEANHELKRAELRMALEKEAYRVFSEALVKHHSEVSAVASKYTVAAFVLDRPPIITYEPTERAVYDGSDLDGLELSRSWSRFALEIETYQIALLPLWHLHLFIKFRLDDAIELINALRMKLAEERARDGSNVTEIVRSETPQIRDALNAVMLYLRDFRIEADNLLVSQLYDNRKAPRRQLPRAALKTLVDIATPSAVAAENEQRHIDAVAWGEEAKRQKVPQQN